MVPTLCVGMPPVALLRPVQRTPERPGARTHAERGNDRALHVLDSARRVLG